MRYISKAWIAVDWLVAVQNLSEETITVELVPT